MTEKKWIMAFDDGDSIVPDWADFDPLFLRLLANRDLFEKPEIELFLKSTYKKNSFDPFLFSDMKKAVDLIIKHLKKQNRIAVYGDYDADGVTSSAILVETLKTLHADAIVYIPHRVNEGYGVNRGAVEFLKNENAKLIITVDNGIRSRDEIAYAQKSGIDVIVTDHHMPPKTKTEYPDCLIINPAIPEEKYPDKRLSGAGVAYKLAEALIKKSLLLDETKELLLKRTLDLAAIGTVADCVKLIGENRLIVKAGLEVMANTKRPGLLDLYEAAKINSDKKLDSRNIGFQIAPRLNAAGRMDHANTAYKLLITRDRTESKRLAGELNLRNQERQKNTEEIFTEVEGQVNPEKDKIIIGIYNLDNDKEKEADVWNEGVIGLVSGRITSKYHRPSLVITKTESGYKGSGRSISGFNLIKAIESCAPYLDKYGGHPEACGFSLKNETLDIFLKSIRAIAEKELFDADFRPRVKIDSWLNFENINRDFYDKLLLFEPFGNGNEKPIFASKNIKVVDIMTMGNEKQHIKFRLKGENSGLLSALSFGNADKWKKIQVGDTIEIAYYLDLNSFNGNTDLQLKIIDIKK